MIKSIHRILDVFTRGVIATLILGWGVLIWQPAMQLGALWLGAWMILAYVPMSLLTLFLYASDKRRAKKQGAWRTPEAMLLRLNLAGGWLGGAWGQWGLRHKTQKPSFLRRYWLAFSCHLIAWVIIVVRWVGVV